MANGKFTWTPIGGSLQTYTCAVQYTFASRLQLSDKTDRGRAIDGTMRTYAFGLKKTYVIAFKNIPLAQVQQLQTIKEAQVDVSFYADGSTLTLTGQWINAFNFTETAPGLYAGTIQLEEV
jgi:hypothetical protein